MTAKYDEGWMNDCTEKERERVKVLIDDGDDLTETPNKKFFFSLSSNLNYKNVNELSNFVGKKVDPDCVRNDKALKLNT